MSSIQHFLTILLLMLVELGGAIEIFVKVDGEFIPVPGNYKLIETDHKLNSHRRMKRSFEDSRPVVVNGVTRNVHLSELFRMYVTLGTDAARRAAFSPREQGTVGRCEIPETIIWPANCHRLGHSRVGMCRSPARGIVELRMNGCSTGS